DMDRRASLVVMAVSGLAVACGSTVLEADQGGGGSGAGAGAGDGGGAGGAAGSAGAGADSAGGAGATSGSGNAGSGAASGGTTEWAKAFGVNGHQHLRGLASDAQGNVLLAGSFDGQLDFGAGPLPQKGLSSSFAAKLD